MTIVDAGGIKPLISVLGVEQEPHAELAAFLLVRLARGNPEVSVEIADKGGVLPLVKLLSTGSVGSQQLASSCLTELALVSSNRDLIANAGGIAPLIKLLSSTTIGTPRSARARSRTSRTRTRGRAGARRGGAAAAAARRDARLRRAPREDHCSGGIGRLIDMVSGTNPTTNILIEKLKGLGDVKDDSRPRSA